MVMESGHNGICLRFKLYLVQRDLRNKKEKKKFHGCAFFAFSYLLFILFIPLVGSSKRKWWGKDKNTQKKQAHELDNGMVPLPAKVCFICRK